MNIKVIKQKSTEELRTDKVEVDKRETKSKVFFYVIMGVLGLISLLLIVFFYWTLQSDKVLEIKNAPVPVRPTTIDTDQYILLHYDYCKYKSVHGIVETSLVSKTTVLPLPIAKDTTEKDCKAFDAPYPVPGNTPPETYHYHFKACYPLNPIKIVCTEWDSKTFDVEGPRPDINIEIPKK